MAHGCPVLQPSGTSYGNRYHDGLTVKDIESDLDTYVTILRDPTTRFVSSFCEGMTHHHGLSHQLKTQVNAVFNHDANWKTNETAIIKNFKHYTQLPYV